MTKKEQAYKMGQRHAGTQDLTVLAYGPDGDDLDIVWEHAVLNLFWECGYYGLPAPRWVTAERYGNIPEGGKSRNHRDNQLEPGVSAARLIGEDDDYDWTATISSGFGNTDRPIIRIEGWLHHKYGSDGEPIIVGAK